MEGCSGAWVPAMEAMLGLAKVGGGGDVVNREIVGYEEAAEMEELVEVALCGKRDQYDRHLRRRWVVAGGHIV